MRFLGVHLLLVHAAEAQARKACELLALFPPYKVLARTVLSASLLAQGRLARRALRGLRTRAEDIPDLALRERFLRRVPENARILELAHQRWGETWGGQ